MRNIDKIKELEKELGRYRKKVTDQEKIITKQRKDLETADQGNREVQALVDATITAVVLEHGVVANDPDTGAELGWRLEVPIFSVKDLREKYQIRARRDEADGKYVMGVMLREQASDPA